MSQVVALSDRRLVLLVRGWAPFVMLLVAYELMRDAASALGMPAHDLARLDRTLFDGYQPTLVLQDAIGKLADAELFEETGSLVYATHFLLPVAVGAWLWTKDREAFRRFALTLVVLCGLAFVTYVIAPTAPPLPKSPSSGVACRRAWSGCTRITTTTSTRHSLRCMPASPWSLRPPSGGRAARPERSCGCGPSLFGSWSSIWASTTWPTSSVESSMP